MASALILRAQEKERARVARELHDDTGQALTLILIRLQLLADQLSDSKARAEIADLRVLVADALESVRRLAVDLGPTVLDELGLASAIEWLAERVRTDARIRVDLHLDLDTEPAHPIALAIFRVAQEALTNVVRHARAARVSIRLTGADGRVRVVIADDGVGFDAVAARSRYEENVGLVGMAERIALVEGVLSLSSERGRGTTVTADVPLRRGR